MRRPTPSTSCTWRKSEGCRCCGASGERRTSSTSRRSTISSRLPPGQRPHRPHRLPPARRRRAAGLGLVLGLGLLTKSSDLLLFPAALVALLLATQTVDGGYPPRVGGQTADAALKRTRAPLPELPSTVYRLPSTAFLRGALVVFGLALLIGGGWMARNVRLYGDPLGTRAFEQYFQDTLTTAAAEQLFHYDWLDLLWRKVLPLTFDSFWGVFGHMQFFMGAY